MRLAADPAKVGFPASIVAMAVMSHALCGSEELAIKGFKTRTAGTLLTRSDKQAAVKESTGGRAQRMHGKGKKTPHDGHDRIARPRQREELLKI